VKQAIAFARTAAEERLIEQALDAGQVTYSCTLDVPDEAGSQAVCFLAHAYEVETEDAESGREILRCAGLGALIAS